MATWSKATLAARVLKSLGVVGEGQTPTSEQQRDTEEAVDSVYKRLKRGGWCPFLLTAIPEEAQIPLRKIVAGEIAEDYGYAGQRLLDRQQASRLAMKELARATNAGSPILPVKVKYY